MILDPATIVESAGLLGIFLVLYTESGLLLGFFLPGDTLLFAAGIFASQGLISLPLLIIVASLASILGDNTGYFIGKRMGRKLFERDTAMFFNKKQIDRSERFYKKYGPMTIIVSRFIPIIRTLAPLIAGVANMQYKKFFNFNVIGGILWGVTVPLLGYYLGGLIPDPDKFLLPIIFGVITLSFVPVIVRFIYYLITKFCKK